MTETHSEKQIMTYDDKEIDKMVEWARRDALTAYNGGMVKDMADMLLQLKIDRASLRKSYPVDLDMDAAMRRAEAAEKERDEYFLQWQNLRLRGDKDWQARAEAAEKREASWKNAFENERKRHRDISIKEVLDRIARAALEAKP